MTQPIPADHVIGDSGHTNDHNSVVTTLTNFNALIAALQTAVATLQGNTANLFYTTGGNVCNIQDLVTALATVNLQATNRDTGVDIFDVFYGTQKVFSFNSYGDIKLFPSTISHTAFTIQGLAGQTANLWQIMNSAGTVLASIGPTGNLVVSGNLRAQGQVNGTNPTTGNAETWHPFNPLSNSWAVPSGGFAQYRITPQNELQISALIQAPASSVNGVTIATFPAGYRPASMHQPVVSTSALIGSVGNGYVTITSGGVMQSSNIGAGATVGIEAKIPLDV